MCIRDRVEAGTVGCYSVAGHRNRTYGLSLIHIFKPDGTQVIEADKASIVVNGVTYHTFGADAWKEYSGFDQQHLAEMTRTGFSFKKFLSPTPVDGNNSLGRCV